MGAFRALGSEIRDFIYKDVLFENEPIQFYVAMRIYYIITAVYILLFDILMICTGLWKGMPIVLMWLPLHIASFFTTYYFHRRVVFHIFSLGLTVWMFLSVYFLGWDYGAQYFMYPLLVISFFATYRNAGGKALYTVYLCLLHLLIFLYGKSNKPIVPLSDDIAYGLRFLNTIVLFLCMYVICQIFSSTNQSALQKLSYYNEKLKLEAETDPLTGLMNRRSMYRQLENVVGNHNGVSYAIALADIDFFKTINDSLGHDFGDQVLRVISQYFREYMADKGFACRWGGEEFLFLFPEQNGDEAYIHAQTMRNHIEKLAIEYRGKTARITMTFGVEEYDFLSPAALFVKKADEKLYMGKNNGRNQVIF